MSPLIEAATRRLALSSRAIAVPAPRHFTTSTVAQKTVTEAAKDTLKSVDRKVSDKLVDGISAGEKIASKVKGEADTGKVKGTAEEIRGQAKGQAKELEGKVKGTAEEIRGSAKSHLES
ncbi:uncharacterized protein F4807DRAFT_433770 [Annulohypoxylon truncatum]|uniref:uncharacterized protein n=1 Tax=Annulohypoxylon truncatum TaxID=327061 RepID=UPI002007D2F4|nr:uncharacterized protein F4807DRAFT_433770 [Annulohypoxylon truncatum]KAI1207564.1 hypothetical protein F4807DRAFT_433770 [Annulohypoxylon truncatum]